MLQIKNTLGGGKPEGLYAWRKSITSYEYNTNKLNIRSEYKLGDAPGTAIDMYVADSYTEDTTNHIYRLTNPTLYSLSDPGAETVGARKYVTLGSPNSRIMIYNQSSMSMTISNNNYSSGKITVKPYSSAYTLFVYKIKETINLSFVDFVIDKNSDKYPNGAEHTDGYYYEKLNENLTLKLFGCTKMAIDKFTYSSIQNAYNVLSINHSLGEVPRLVIILSNFEVSDSNRYITNLMGIISEGANMAFGYTLLYSGDETYSYQGASGQTDSVIRVITTQNEYFNSGVEYTLITMA